MQLSLFPAGDLSNEPANTLIRTSFSHEELCAEEERQRLEQQYLSILEETEQFNRQLVSYQGNKGELIHGWLHYREGFSAELVETLITDFAIEPGDTVLDPFAGSATTLLVAKILGIDAVGIELLPVCHLAWQAKSQFENYDLTELKEIRQWLTDTDPGRADTPFPHIRITNGAFSEQNENALMFYTEWLQTASFSSDSKTLLQLLLTSILEEISFTRKDGQYLRWDSRSPKVQKRNRKRIAQGKKPTRPVDLGPVAVVKAALLQALDVVIADIEKLQTVPFRTSQQSLLQGNTLYLLPTLPDNQFAGVITSPPYCNRYDYTRTYALELAYLEVGQGIFDLRQGQLSCTVENRPKIDQLHDFYRSLDQDSRFAAILENVQGNPVFQEINEALQTRWNNGDINNKGILRMVEQYFTELNFVFAELFRVCQPGAQVAFVNDNVRYGGEIIPVDLLMTELAEGLGFEPVKVYVLPQRKGNSSQQMGRFGREALRKSITIWRKP